MQAVILAGGMGTRLRPLTYTVPKPMLAVAGKPALAHTVEALTQAGCTEVIVTTNYLAELVADGLRDLNSPIKVCCVKEESPLGTAGCIKNIIDDLGDEFLVIQGDAVADMDYASFIEFHRSHDADVTISVIRVQDTREFGIVETDSDGCITRFQEKPRPEEAFSNMANAGFYLLKKRAFDDVPVGEPYDFSKQLFPHLMEQGARFYAWELDGYWVDIGRVQTYLEGNKHRLKGRAVVAPDVILPESVTLVPPFVIGAGTRIGPHCVIGPGTILGQNCTVGANSYVSGSVVCDNVTMGVGVRLTDCVVATGSKLGDHVNVEPMSIIGEGCEIGAGAQLSAHCRVGPVTPVAPGTLVDGVVSPSMQKIEGFQRAMGQAPLMENLTAQEHDVYALLAEFGEMTARELADMSGVPLFNLRSVLSDLETQGVILSTVDVPKRYALTREVPRTSRHILFVDDLSDTREFYRLAFGMQGHSVHLAADGAAAVAAAESEKFDAIIMDVEMPEMDGWEAVRRIRALPDGRDVPIIMFTANDSTEARRKTAEVGADSLIAKPALPQQLLSHAMQFLKQ